MKIIYQTIIGGLLMLLLFSCSEDDLRTVYPHSTPVIESASISPTSFTYGDSLTITASVSDPKTPLSTFEMKLIINDKILSALSLRTAGNAANVSAKFQVPFESELPDGAEAEVQLTLINIEGDETEGSISGITGNRKYYNQLYLITEAGNVFTLMPQQNGSDIYESANLTLNNSIRYKITSAVTGENQIDYTGTVWGTNNNKIQVIDESGDYITSTDASLRKINKIVFDTYSFETTVTGQAVDESGLFLNDFSDVTVSDESFKKITRSLTKNQGLSLYEGLDDTEIVFNPDFFNRIDVDSVQFTGVSGDYDLYYSPSRKTVLVDPSDKTFPTMLFACGMGLGYPSKINQEATTSWGFDNILQCIIFKQVDDNIYQGTIYFDALQANFKFFESTGWSNEKRSDDYTLPSIIASSADKGLTDGNWYATDEAQSGTYRITINLNSKEVTAERINL